LCSTLSRPTPHASARHPPSFPTRRSSDLQVRRLGEILTRSYGRKVQINVAVDPQVVGGMKIQIGDDVVDATTLGRLDEARRRLRSEEHTSELQSRFDLVCRLLLEKTNTDC